MSVGVFQVTFTCTLPVEPTAVLVEVTVGPIAPDALATEYASVNVAPVDNVVAREEITTALVTGAGSRRRKYPFAAASDPRRFGSKDAGARPGAVGTDT